MGNKAVIYSSKILLLPPVNISNFLFNMSDFFYFQCVGFRQTFPAFYHFLDQGNIKIISKYPSEFDFQQ